MAQTASYVKMDIFNSMESAPSETQTVISTPPMEPVKPVFPEIQLETYVWYLPPVPLSIPKENASPAQ
jgi:hypothetical protein